MIKTLSKAQKMEREKFRIPRSVQDAIPIRRIFADGIFQVGNQYSKTWSFTDINYAIAGKEDKTSMFLDYSELLNALDSGASAKITIYNRRINKAEFERSVLLPDRDDGLDEYRHEFNRMLTAQVTGTSNSIVRERYLTVSVVKRNADEARSYFARVGTDLVTHLAQLFSVAQELTLTERLHIFRDFFKAGEQAAAEFNIHEHSKRGQHFKDWFCPDSMEFAADHFKLDARYGRVLYLQDYASYIKDSFVSELCDLDRDLMLSIDILPVPTDEAARQLQSTLLGVETNVANWQRRQNANNNFTATVPYDMELQRKETKEMLDDLTTRDQRMMFGLVTLVRHRNALLHGAQAPVPAFDAALAAEGRSGHGAAVWSAKNPSPAHADHRKHRCADSVSRAGNHAVEWSVLRAERRQQEHDRGGSPLAAQRQQLPFGRFGFRQEYERQGRNRADRALHRG